MQSNTVPAPVATAPQRTARFRKVHDLAALFPEAPGIASSVVRQFPGFLEPGPGVPERVPGFLQDPAFLEEFSYFVSDPEEFMLVLTGPTGCGKSERVRDFYSRLNIPLLSLSAWSEMRLHHFIGSMDLVGGSTQMVWGPLARAMKFGYPFLLDEAYRIGAEITSAFHQIRDHGELFVPETGETIKAKRGFKFLMTSNQRGYGDDTGMYSGDAEQDQAFLNGLNSIECDYPDAKIETEIVQATLERCHAAFRTEPALADYAGKMVKVANQIRRLYVGNDDNLATTSRVEIAVSTRTLKKWGKAFIGLRSSSNKVHPLYRSLDFVCLRKACAATRATVDALLLAEFAIDRNQPV